MPFLSPAIAAARGRKLITNELQIYYDPKQSVSGTTLNDVAPDATNFNLSLNNGVDTSNSNNGFITFDGVNDEGYAATSVTSGVLDHTSTSTLSGWFRLKTLPPVGSVSRISHTYKITDYGGGNYQNTNGLWIDFGLYTAGNPIFLAGGWCNDGSNGGAATYFGLTTFNYSLNQWYFATAVKNDRDYTLYIVDPTTGTTHNRTVSMATGRFTEDGYDGFSKRFNMGAVFGAVPGHVDVGEVMFYTSSLTQSEVYNNYIVTKNEYI